PWQPFGSRKRASVAEPAQSGSPSSSTAVAIAAITPRSLSLIRLSATSPADIERRERGHIDQLGVIGRKRHDLHRPVQSDQNRTYYGGSAELLQQLGRYRRRMECRHDQHVGRARQPAEWIGLAQLHIESDISSHVAV